MENKGWAVELRNHTRFLGSQGAYAAFFTTDLHNFVRLGKIIDISRGGVALRYIGVSEETSGTFILELLGNEKPAVHLGSVPCRVVYDHQLPGESFGLVVVRRCGIEFGHLSEDQLARLDEFIQNYSTPQNETLNS